MKPKDQEQLINYCEDLLRTAIKQGNCTDSVGILDMLGGLYAKRAEASKPEAIEKPAEPLSEPADPADDVGNKKPSP